MRTQTQRAIGAIDEQEVIQFVRPGISVVATSEGKRSSVYSDHVMHIRTLGMLRFEDRAGEECSLATRKTAGLAVYLAMHPEKRFSRNALAGLLWGDKDDAAARHSLSQAVSDLRRRFGRAIICSHSHYLWMAAGAAYVDALELNSLSQKLENEETLEAIDSLYEGDFLDGIDLQQDAFECWGIAERERLRQISLKALSELVNLKMRLKEFDAALEGARKIACLEPYDERNHRSIIRCYSYKGMRRHAIEHYEALSANLNRELGVRPETATTELYSALLEGSGPQGEGRTLTEYAFVLEQLPYSVIVTDNANRIVGWNRISEQAFGFSKAEMFGRSPMTISLPDGSSIDESHGRAVMGVARSMQEVTIKTKNGRASRQMWVVTPLYGPEGERVGAFGHGFIS